MRIYVATHGSSVKSALVAGDFNAVPPRLAQLEAALRWCPATRARIAALTAATLDDDDLGVPRRPPSATRSGRPPRGRSSAPAARTPRARRARATSPSRRARPLPESAAIAPIPAVETPETVL